MVQRENGHFHHYVICKMFLMRFFFTTFPGACLQSILYLSLHLSQDHDVPAGGHGFNLDSISIGAGEFQYLFTISKAKIKSYFCPALPSDDTNHLSPSPPLEQKSSEVYFRISSIWHEKWGYLVVLRQMHKPFPYGLEEALYGFHWSNPTPGSVRWVPEIKVGKQVVLNEVESELHFFPEKQSVQRLLGTKYISQLEKNITMWLQAALLIALKLRTDFMFNDWTCLFCLVSKRRSVMA